LQARLNWRHQYVGTSETAYALGAFTSGAGSPLDETASQPQSLAAHQLAVEHADALAKAAEIEQKHIISRWTPDSAEYQQAALQRKCFHIHRLQDRIAADIDWLHWSKTVVSRNPHQHRGTSSDILKRIRQKHILMRESLKQLKEWHAVPGDIGHVTYNPSDLKAEEMQQADFQIPWLQSQTTASLQQTQRKDLEQRITRCDEEVAILSREANDMLEFYRHRRGALRAALHSRSTNAAPISEQIDGSYSDLQQQLLSQQASKRQMHILSQKMHRCQQLLCRAELLASSLAMAAVSDTDLPKLPVFDKQSPGMPDLACMGSDHESYSAADADEPAFDCGDPAQTDVGSYDDVPLTSIDDDSDLADLIAVQAHGRVYAVGGEMATLGE